MNFTVFAWTGARSGPDPIWPSFSDCSGNRRSTYFVGLSCIFTARKSGLDSRTTRLCRPRQPRSSVAAFASTASHRAFVTIASRPSYRVGWPMEQVIWVKNQAEYFRSGYWTQRWCIRLDRQHRGSAWTDEVNRSSVLWVRRSRNPPLLACRKMVGYASLTHPTVYACVTAARSRLPLARSGLRPRWQRRRPRC